MSQTLTISIDRAQTENVAEFRRYLEDAVGGKDRMDEARRKVQVSDIDAVPIVGPRGGIRRYSTVMFRDDICEDVDEEEAMIARLDGDVETDDEDAGDWDDEEEPSDPFEPEDDRITVNGLGLDMYLTYVGEGRDYGLACDDLPLTAAEMMQEELEVEMRRPMGYKEDRVVTPGNRQRPVRLRDAAIQRRTRGKQELRELLLTDTDPWTARADLERHELLELDREQEALNREADRLLHELMLAEDARHEELGYFCQPSEAELSWLALEESVDPDDLDDEELGHAVQLCWIAGMDEDETLRMLEQLRTAIYPVSDEEADLLLKFYGLGHEDDSDWDIDPPRQSGEFGRAIALLDDDFDDVPPSIARLARKRDEEDAEERTRRRKYAAH